MFTLHYQCCFQQQSKVKSFLYHYNIPSFGHVMRHFSVSGKYGTTWKAWRKALITETIQLFWKSCRIQQLWWESGKFLLWSPQIWPLWQSSKMKVLVNTWWWWNSTTWSTAALTPSLLLIKGANIWLLQNSKFWNVILWWSVDC